ncbi:TraB/GumN family protein [Photobacterium kagoshimensis]|uniref:TraB/GumN family protein n=1 Tax=Photobacterium kagoshimensis TaxID=2910242 RepID=UPI003D12822A
MLKSFFSKLFLVLPFLASSAFAEPMVWHATDGQRQFTILGSIHVGTQDMYPLPEIFLNHWQAADGLIVEANILDTKMPSFTFNPPLTHALLDESDTHKLNQIAKQLKLKPNDLAYAPPWYSVMSIQLALAYNLGLQADLGVDYILLERAANQSMPIHQLESVAKQFDMMKALPKNGLDMLLETIHDWDEVDDQLDCLIAAWQDGDKGKLDSLFAESSYSDETDFMLIDQRNINWVEQLNDIKKYPAGNYMLVVGAFHLIGEQGLPNLLKEKGFSVQLLTQGSQSQCEW